MELKQVIKLIVDEKRAYRYLKSFRWHGKPSCPRCGSSSLLYFSNKRYECKSCSCRFSYFSGTNVVATKLFASQVLLGVKPFELGLSAREAAKQAEVNYKSMLRLFHTPRQATVDYSHQTTTAPLSCEVEMDETYFGGKRKGRRGRGSDKNIPLFGMMECNGKVVVEPVPNVSAETLTGIVKEHVRPGSRTYTDQFRSYNSLLIKGYEHIRIDHNKRFANGRAYINSIEGFWSYAKKRLAKFHLISSILKYPYLKDFELFISLPWE